MNANGKQLAIVAAIDAPYSQEAEQAVIGSILINPDSFYSIDTFLRAEDFFLLRHTRLWQAFQRMTKRREPIDFTTLVTELRGAGVLDEIGGRAYLMQMINETSTSVHAEIYGRLVERTAIRRKMLEAADQIKQLALDESQDTEAVLLQTEQLTVRLRANRFESRLITSLEAMSDIDEILHQRIKLYQKNPNYTLGIRTCFSQLDQVLDGLPVGITTIAAATAMGKTAAVLSIALNASRYGIDREEKRPANVVMFSGEMTQEQLSWRMLAMKSEVNLRSLRRGSLTRQEYGHYESARDSIADDHCLQFESAKRMSITNIQDRVRQLALEKKLDLLILDGLLQIDALKADNGFTPTQRRDMIETILNDLEGIAATYEIRILLTHQLSRAPNTRADKRPVLSDLAEANFVEQKSHTVLFLFRPGYYDQSFDQAETELIIAKNRDGKSGVVKLFYNAEFTRFEDGRMVHVDLTQD